MKPMTIAASLLLVATLSAVAHAGPTDEPTTPLSPDTAFGLSAVGAGVPAAAAGVGALMAIEGAGSTRDDGLGVLLVSQLVGLITPSLGELYSRQIVTGGMGMRAAGLLVESLGLFRYYNHEIGDCETTGPACHHPGATYALIFSGAALYAGGMLYDVAHAREAATSWNRRHDLVVAPTALKTTSSVAPGVALALTF